MQAQPRNSFGLAAVAGAVTLVLSACSAHNATKTVEATPQIMRSLLNGYARAIETNNHEYALRHIHPHSPARSEIDSQLREQLSAYLETSRVANLDRISQTADTSAARVDQEIVRIFGLKIIRSKQSAIVRFRPLGDVWRIWDIEILLPDELEETFGTSRSMHHAIGDGSNEFIARSH